MTPLAVLSSGMVTGVGWSTAAACAAIRVGISGFVETEFMYDGAFVQGCPVPFDAPCRGLSKLVEMAATALDEALAPAVAGHAETERIPLLLCVSETSRAGRFSGLESTILDSVAECLGCAFHSRSTVIPDGRIGGVHALMLAREIMDQDREIEHTLVCGVDTLLVTKTLDHYHKRRRLLTARHSDGFIPGEAAGAVLLGRLRSESRASIAVTGIGLGEEPAPIDSGKPLRADGLVMAIREAMSEAGIGFDQLAYRLTDNSGEQFGYKESALAMTRVVRPVKPEFDIQHPADCIGEVGAATVPTLLAVASVSESKGYAPGRFMGDGVLCHIGSDGAARAALVLRSVSALCQPPGAA